jgi:hypothetical protein
MSNKPTINDPSRSTQPVGSAGAASTGATPSAARTGSAGEGSPVVDEETKQRAARVVDSVQNAASETVNSKLSSAAGQVGSVAAARRRTGENLGSENQQTARHYVDMAADQVERLSSYLDSHDLGEIVGQVEETVRRQPALVIGGAFVLGLLGARFLKSSSSRREGASGAPHRYRGDSGRFADDRRDSRRYERPRGYRPPLEQSRYGAPLPPDRGRYAPFGDEQSGLRGPGGLEPGGPMRPPEEMARGGARIMGSPNPPPRPAPPAPSAPPARGMGGPAGGRPGGWSESEDR